MIDQVNAAPDAAESVSPLERYVEEELKAEDEASNNVPADAENAVVEGDDAIDSQAPEKDKSEEDIDIEYDGKSFKVPKELEAAFLMQKDYTQKTQGIAEKERSLEAERQAVLNVRNVSAQEIQLAAQLVDVDTKIQSYLNVDWHSLYQQDSAQFSWHQKQLNDLKEMRTNGMQQMQYLQLQRDSETQVAKAKRLEIVRQDVNNLIPKYNEDLDRKLMSYAVSKGFEPSTLSNISSAKEVDILYKAYQWDQLQASKANVVKKVEQLPRVIKPGAPQTDKESNRGDLMKKLKQTGSREIGRRLLEDYL